MSNHPSSNNNIIPESPPPPPSHPMLRHHSNDNNPNNRPPHLDQPQLVNKYTTPSRLVATNTTTTTAKSSPEARQDASSSYELRTPPQEHRSLVSKDSFKHNSDGGVASLRQSLSWSSPPHGKSSGSMGAASPVNGWPQRSPMNPQHDASADSFALFTQSFDTLSESLQHDESSSLPNKIHLKARPAQPNLGNLSPIQLERGTPAATSGHYPHSYPPHSQPPPPPHHGPYQGDTPPYHSEHGPAPYPQYDGPRAPPPPYEESSYAYPPLDPTGRRMGRGQDEMHHRSNPFFVLRTAHKAFWGCSYLLPCLENREVIPIHLGVNPSVRLLQDPACIPEPQQVAVAKRRVETAICTFGGHLPPSTPPLDQPQDSIFRRRPDASSKPGWKLAYEERLEGRYAVKSNHIEWKLEENPPIDNMHVGMNRPSSSSNTKSNDTLETELVQETLGSTVSVVTLENNQQKMKYRCKLCGQLKQNHVCPYQQSLQRSIGITVYPAANAYTASEPGQLTKSLAEMNNFVSYEDSSSTEHWMRRMPYSVTPETKRGGVHSPSSLTTVDSIVEAGDGSTPFSSRKRHDKKPFVKTLTLRQEHYRAVTPMASEDGFEYQYPHVPLTFRERKRLSDTLFYLSKQIPDTTVPVASLLRTARERNEWDLCVAELLTQIVVALYCREGDHRLDGLQDYLLRLGVAC